MRPQILTQTGAGTSAMCVLDQCNPFTLSLAVDVTGTVAFTIEHTYDDPQLGANVVVWRAKAALTTKTAALEDGFTDAPIRALRINQASGSGTTKLTILQPTRGG